LATRLSLREAADILGVSKEAVRRRAIRGTLPSETGDDGRRYVYLEVGDDTSATKSEPDALISAKDETIATLKEPLEAERQAHAEARRIIAGLVERIPAIEAPETSEEPAEGAEPRPATGEA
jgi:hypothetical protein